MENHLLNSNKKKTVIICGKSADAFWKRSNINFRKLKIKNPPADYIYNITKKDSIQIAAQLKLPLPLHLMSPSRSNNCRCKSIICMARTQSYPLGSFVTFNLQNYYIFVESPELLFLEKSKSMNFIDCIKSGYELCGNYFIDSSGNICTRDPITSKAKIIEFLEKATSIYGRKKALSAIKYVADNSRSPRETGISMHIGFPISDGGYGLNDHLLNINVFLNEISAKIIGKGILEVDIGWKNKKIVIDYNSNMHHADPEDLARDAARLNALLFSGYQYYVITADTMNNFIMYDALMRGIRENLGYDDEEEAMNNNYKKRKMLYEQIIWNK